MAQERVSIAQRVVDRGLLIRMLVTLTLLAVIYTAFVLLVFAVGEGAVALLATGLAVTAILFPLGPQAALRTLKVRILRSTEHPELHERLRRLALLMGIPAPRLGFVDSPVPNAFSIGYALTLGGVGQLWLSLAAPWNSLSRRSLTLFWHTSLPICATVMRLYSP